VTKLSKLPLAHQPGTVWEYGMSTDVLGRIVEVVSGMAFDQLWNSKSLGPLGMRDTAFYLSGAQGSRLRSRKLILLPGETARRERSRGSHQGETEMVLWRGRVAVDGGRLCAVLPDAAEPGRAEWRSTIVAKNDCGDDIGPAPAWRRARGRV